jgi:hypothetical protein
MVHGQIRRYESAPRRDRARSATVERGAGGRSDATGDARRLSLRAVRFRVTADLDGVTVCNCSICTKKGIWHLIVRHEQFELLAGKDDLATYTFNTGVAKHHFCKTCGIHPFYIPRSDPDKIDVNARCLDDFETLASSPSASTAATGKRRWKRTCPGDEAGPYASAPPPPQVTSSVATWPNARSSAAAAAAASVTSVGTALRNTREATMRPFVADDLGRQFDHARTDVRVEIWKVRTSIASW